MNKNGKAQRREIGKYLVIDPEICHGSMTFKGTRVPVATVLALLGKGYSFEQMLKSYPEITRPALSEAIRRAINTLQKHYAPRHFPRRHVAA